MRVRRADVTAPRSALGRWRESSWGRSERRASWALEEATGLSRHGGRPDGSHAARCRRGTPERDGRGGAGGGAKYLEVLVKHTHVWLLVITVHVLPLPSQCCGRVTAYCASISWQFMSVR
ncbi:zinc finger SWIM domain-containing protein 7 isoform X2 [Canis lupus familiaris]|uniref:zinc finger SWIM domain-containing protein 7 isoform X2 n=1 Tax=Canis lupus familiaris TaxID=9615 RepID=UPI0018F64419|nr:zinc finger SWIM domain-containing protein 7 isoform X2 [Canis lupus familiaris]XP_038392949.1 zinc finger SWIM domain-containing protein 7 isoform X2 [Canis lupus familiaris]XP_038521660.1 zinc finger SWIM domain-containing protein 7 isoform X2 [Canis lupus familiaris]